MLKYKNTIRNITDKTVSRKSLCQESDRNVYHHGSTFIYRENVSFFNENKNDNEKRNYCEYTLKSGWLRWRIYLSAFGASRI